MTMTAPISPSSERIGLPRISSRSFWIPAAFLTLLFAFFLVAILVLNQGVFSYSIDDPYIHLALAENIAQGNYGVNTGELCAPSSSIIWPFMLVPFVMLGVDHLVPLFINFIASLGVIAFLGGLMALLEKEEGGRGGRHLSWLLVLFLVPALNLAGLAFTGMEQSLQVLLAVALTCGLIVEVREGRAPWWLIAAIIVGPLVRYENTALSALAVVFLLFRGHIRWALISGAAVGAALLGFSLFLHSLGLGFFPASVQAKSYLVGESGGGLWGLVQSAILSLLGNILGVRLVAVFAVAICFFVVVLVSSRRSRPEKGLALFGAAMILIQLSMGRFGGFGRYEIYALAAAVVLLLYLYRGQVFRLVSQGSAFRLGICLLVVVSLLFPYYVFTTASTPLASNNIYEQQYQMHRFVQEHYQGDVAINDLGWVSYRNDRYVLDLFGLACRESLKLRTAGGTGQWMNRLAKEKGVKLAMIYDIWFPAVPKEWVPLGKLYLGKKRISPTGKMVSFYAIDKSVVPAATGRLRDFKKTLPEGVRFVFSQTAKNAHDSRGK